MGVGIPTPILFLVANLLDGADNGVEAGCDDQERGEHITKAIEEKGRNPHYQQHYVPFLRRLGRLLLYGRRYWPLAQAYQR